MTIQVHTFTLVEYTEIHHTEDNQDLEREVDMIMSDVFGDMDWMEQEYATEDDSDTGSAIGMNLEL